MEATSYILDIDPDDCAALADAVAESTSAVPMAKAAMIIDGVPDPRSLTEEGIWLLLEGEIWEGNLGTEM